MRGAQRVARLVQHPEKLLSIVLLGNTLVNTAAVALATALALDQWPNHGVLIATGGLTVVLLVLCETTPKTLAALHSERLSLAFVRPLELFSWVLTPFVAALSWTAAGVSRLVGVAPAHGALVSDEEIRSMISLGHREGEMEAAEAQLLDRVFEFGDRPVREVMVPRPEVVAIELGSRVSDFLALYAENPLSRFPVYRDNMDNVVGILAIKDVLMAQARGAVTRHGLIDDLMRPPRFTPETNRVSELFAEMRGENYRMAVVVDEFGGTAGIVSLTRLVEEIVGPVGDELAVVEKEYEVINANTFQIDGGMRVEEANEEMDLDLPEGDYETVAGFILYLLGRIPLQNEQLSYKDMRLVITEMRGVKIEKILLTREGHGGTV